MTTLYILCLYECLSFSRKHFVLKRLLKLKPVGMIWFTNIQKTVGNYYHLKHNQPPYLIKSSFIIHIFN